ncbi:MAG TPA: TPM domain-containing protein [Ktedonobacteraceae bacterium]|nr:TPM domain-containing protein [Ktedonobacteraceae bacterium]
MTTLKRLPFFMVLFVTLGLVFIGLQAKTVHAQQVIPAGSCGDTVSDDAQLFGSRIGDVLNQAKAMNDSLQADTRVVTVSQDKLAGSSLRAYYNFILSKCPNWTGPNAIILIMAKGQEPFLHLGSNFSGKMTAADFQQMTLSIRSEFDSGNYAQAAIDLLKQVQKKLSPDYTWIWVTLAVLVVLVTGGVLAVMIVRRRRTVANAANARESAIRTKEAAVNAISQLDREIEDLSPRIEVLLALIPQGTAMQLRGLFETAEGKARGVQERLGNLLGNPDTNPGSKTFQPAQYAQMQGAYQQVYYEAQEPLYLLHAVQTAVQRLESNPQEQIDFQQLATQSFAQGQRSISQPGYPSESTWAGR